MICMFCTQQQATRCRKRDFLSGSSCSGGSGACGAVPSGPVYCVGLAGECIRDPGQDVAAFKSSGGHILVGTPGRLNDVMQRLGPAMDTKTLEVLVSGALQGSG